METIKAEKKLLNEAYYKPLHDELNNEIDSLNTYIDNLKKEIQTSRTTDILKSKQEELEKKKDILKKYKDTLKNREEFNKDFKAEDDRTLIEQIIKIISEQSELTPLIQVQDIKTEDTAYPNTLWWHDIFCYGYDEKNCWKLQKNISPLPNYGYRIIDPNNRILFMSSISNRLKIQKKFKDIFNIINFNEQELIIVYSDKKPLSNKIATEQGSFYVLNEKNFKKFKSDHHLIFDENKNYVHAGEVYVRHPYINNKYIEVENSEVSVFHDTINLFSCISTFIGATEIKSKLVSKNMSDRKENGKISAKGKVKDEEVGLEIEADTNDVSDQFRSDAFNMTFVKNENRSERQLTLGRFYELLNLEPPQQNDVENQVSDWSIASDLLKKLKLNSNSKLSSLVLNRDPGNQQVLSTFHMRVNVLENLNKTLTIAYNILATAIESEGSYSSTLKRERRLVYELDFSF